MSPGECELLLDHLDLSVDARLFNLYPSALTDSSARCRRTRSRSCRGTSTALRSRRLPSTRSCWSTTRAFYSSTTSRWPTVASTRVAPSPRLARRSVARRSTSRVSGHSSRRVYGLCFFCSSHRYKPHQFGSVLPMWKTLFWNVRHVVKM